MSWIDRRFVRWPDWCFLAYFVGMFAVSAMGLGDPSPGAASIAYDLAVWLHSGLGLLFSVVAVLGIITRRRAAAVQAILGLAVTTLIHGLALMLADPPGIDNLQAGLRLVIAPLMMVPSAWSWRVWMAFREQSGRLTDEREGPANA